jgi:hypothetical protein
MNLPSTNGQPYSFPQTALFEHNEADLVLLAEFVHYLRMHQLDVLQMEAEQLHVTLLAFLGIDCPVLEREQIFQSEIIAAL